MLRYVEILDLPNPYFVEKSDEVLALEVKNLETNEFLLTLKSKAFICRFNDFLP